MSAEKLNKSGLTILWNKIANSFARKSDVYTKTETETKITEELGKLPQNSIATTSSNGLMSSGDKTKLNSLISTSDITDAFNATFK